MSKDIELIASLSKMEQLGWDLVFVAAGIIGANESPF